MIVGAADRRPGSIPARIGGRYFVHDLSGRPAPEDDGWANKTVAIQREITTLREACRMGLSDETWTAAGRSCAIFRTRQVPQLSFAGKQTTNFRLNIAFRQPFRRLNFNGRTKVRPDGGIGLAVAGERVARWSGRDGGVSRGRLCGCVRYRCHRDELRDARFALSQSLFWQWHLYLGFADLDGPGRSYRRIFRRRPGSGPISVSARARHGGTDWLRLHSCAAVVLDHLAGGAAC